MGVGGRMASSPRAAGVLTDVLAGVWKGTAFLGFFGGLLATVFGFELTPAYINMSAQQHTQYHTQHQHTYVAASPRCLPWRERRPQCLPRGRRSPPWRERRPRCLPRGRAHPHGVASLGSSPRSRLQTLVAWERQWVSLLCAHALYAQLALSM